MKANKKTKVKKKDSKKAKNKAKAKGKGRKPKLESVDDVMADLAKDFAVEVMTEDSEDKIPYYIPFRHTGLQMITGGVPGGRFTEIQGDSQSGKSFLLYELMMEAINMGGAALVHDVERALEPRYMRTVGMSGNSSIGISYERNLQRVFLLSRKFAQNVRKVKKDEPIIIGIDSFPPLQTFGIQKEIDAQIKKGNLTQKDVKGYKEAKKNAEYSTIMGDFITFLDDYAVTLVMLNQLKKKMGVVFGDPFTTNADNITKYYVTLRLRGLIGAKIKNEAKTRQIGVSSTWETIKNRNIAPFKKAKTKILYKTGVQRHSGLIDLLVDEELAEKVKNKPKAIIYHGKQYDSIKKLMKKRPALFEPLRDVEEPKKKKGGKKNRDKKKNKDKKKGKSKK